MILRKNQMMGKSPVGILKDDFYEKGENKRTMKVLTSYHVVVDFSHNCMTYGALSMLQLLPVGFNFIYSFTACEINSLSQMFFSTRPKQEK